MESKAPACCTDTRQRAEGVLLRRGHARVHPGKRSLRRRAQAPSRLRRRCFAWFWGRLDRILAEWHRPAPCEEAPERGIDEIRPMFCRVVARGNRPAPEIRRPWSPGLERLEVAAAMTVRAPQYEDGAADLFHAEIRLVHGEVQRHGCPVILADRVDLLGCRAPCIFGHGFGREN